MPFVSNASCDGGGGILDNFISPSAPTPRYMACDTLAEARARFFDKIENIQTSYNRIE